MVFGHYRLVEMLIHFIFEYEFLRLSAKSEVGVRNRAIVYV